MSSKNCHCGRPSHGKGGNKRLCAVHYRIDGMRVVARRHNKYVPSRTEIEALIPDPFICFGCGEEMHWLREDGTHKQATLQHDRGGTIRIICLACNSGHAGLPDDLFYNIPEGEKYCPTCKETKPKSEFYKLKRSKSGTQPYCKKCSYEKHAKWQRENKDTYNRIMREYRARKRIAQ